MASAKRYVDRGGPATLGRIRRRPDDGVALAARQGWMSELRVTSAAERDFTDALCWYAVRSQRAAEGFDEEFDKALKTITVDPRRYPLCDERHRFYLLDRYPYQVIYRDEIDKVVVVAVAHAKRKPRYWAGRL
jgi:plasmid stabilization system protein ParE